MLDKIADNRVHFGKNHTTVPNNKTYLKNTEYQSLTSMRFVDGRSASKRLQSLFGVKVFTNPKDELLLKDIFKAMGVGGDDTILDFFAGSASTIHAVFELNKEYSSSCSAILVQLPEDLHEMYKTAKGSSKKVTKNAIDYLKKRDLPQNISEIAKDRIRLVGNKFREDWTGDVGFRVLKVDSSNMADICYTPDETKQTELFKNIDNIKDDRTPEDLLFQVLLDWGVDLALPITKENIADLEVFFVDGNALAACFVNNGQITEDFCKELAKREPLRVVFRDSGFSDDSVKINVEQIFKLISPHTDMKTI